MNTKEKGLQGGALRQNIAFMTTFAIVYAICDYMQLHDYIVQNDQVINAINCKHAHNRNNH